MAGIERIGKNEGLERLRKRAEEEEKMKPLKKEECIPTPSSATKS